MQEKKIFKLSKYAGKYIVNAIPEIDCTTDEIQRVCKCGCIFIGTIAAFPHNLDYILQRVNKDISTATTSFMRENSNAILSEAKTRFMLETPKCECGEYISETTFIEPECIQDKDYTLVRTWVEPSLDPKYVNLPKDHILNKQWHNLDGGIKEWEDLHERKFVNTGFGIHGKR